MQRTQQALEKLREKYTEKLPSHLNEIRRLWNLCQNNGWDKQAAAELEYKCHNLAGTAATFGHPEISVIASQIEGFLKTTPQKASLEPSLITNIAKTVASLPLNPASASQNAKEVMLTKSLTRLKSLDARPVIIIDQDTDFANKVAEGLHKVGFETQFAESFEALVKTGDCSNLGIIIADIDHAAATPLGHLAIKKIHQQQILKSPIVYTSADDSFDSRLKAVRAQSDGYFVKPFEVNALLDYLQVTVKTESSKPFRVLVIDDDQLLAEHYQQLLNAAGFEADHINKPQHIAQKLADFAPELILLDMHMPKCSGFELAQILHQEPGYQHIPIVFLTSEKDQAVQNQARLFGADDYLLKPIAADYLISSVWTRAHRTRLLNARIRNDSMTGLLNHAAFEEELSRELYLAKRHQRPLSLGLIDIDHFKSINDTYGHLAGDMVIKQLGQMLRSRFRRTDIVARYGGEEFAIILPETQIAEAKRLIQDLLDAFEAQSFIYNQQTFKVTFSAGVAELNGNESITESVEKADILLYRAKDLGRNQIIGCAD